MTMRDREIYKEIQDLHGHYSKTIFKIQAILADTYPERLHSAAYHMLHNFLLMNWEHSVVYQSLPETPGVFLQQSYLAEFVYLEATEHE